MTSRLKPPIFIIGSPRSGTTLLRLMLNNHGKIVVPPECGFAVWWHDKYREWSKSPSRDPCLLDQFLKDLRISRKIETWKLDYSELRNYIEGEDPARYADLVSCVYAFFGTSTGKTFHRWGDKNNFHVKHIATIHTLFKDAFFVHIVRDGRDVACSYRSLGKTQFSSQYAPSLPTSITKIADEWVGNIQAVLSSFNAIGWRRVLEIRYEDLVARSEAELKRICRFLDEPYDARMLRYHVYNEAEQQEPVEFLAWKQKTLREPTTSEIGKFREQLTSEQIETFENRSGRVLERYGYELTG